jgi:hypothetical protein
MVGRESGYFGAYPLKGCRHGRLMAAIVTLIPRAAKAPDGVDRTTRDDFFAD